MNETVDVLIIGSGASGAAVAWSLADTRMKILCLEQGDWMKQADYPSNGRDWEARLYDDFATSPNRRARPTDYPINDDNSPIKVVNFNGVGGSTIMYTGHYPRLHPSDFRVRTLDGVADDWPIDYATLEPFFAENDRMTGVSGLAGDPAYPPKQPPMPPLPLGKSGTRFAHGDEPARLALVAVGHLGRHGRVRRAGAVHQSRPLHAGLHAGSQGEHRHHLLAACDPRRGGTAHALPGARDHRQRARHGVGRDLLRRRRAWSSSSRPRSSSWPATAWARRGCCSIRCRGGFPNGLANSSGLVGKNLMFHPYAQVYGYVEEPLDSNRAPPLCLWSMEFYETDLEPRFRPRLRLPVRPRHRPGHRGDLQPRRRTPALGRGPPPRISQTGGTAHRPVGDLRGPAGGAQPGDARSGAEGRARHPRAEGRLHDQRELAAHDGPRHRAREGDPGGGRRHRMSACKARS